MSETSKVNVPKKEQIFSAEVGASASRKLKAQRHVTQVWSGFGMMGVVGWSIVVPTLLGAAFGTWLDRYYRSKHSWTLVLLIAGLLIGCWNAWRWLAKEDRKINEGQDD